MAAMVAILTFTVGMPQEALVIGSVLIMPLIIIYYGIGEYEGKEPVKGRFFD
jgi:hypothetical protein